MLRQTVFSTSLLTVLLTVPVLAQQQGKQYPINFVNQFKQAQDHRLEADNKLIDNMEAVADWMVQFRLKFGHFPEAGVEQDKATKYLQNRLMKPNPFSETGIASNEEKKALCPLRFVHDIGLIDPNRQEWEKKIPADWKADPGTITVIYNEYDNVVLWAAGADHNPVYDIKESKYYLAWRSLKED